MDTCSQFSILVQFGACSRERLAILPNTVTCSRSPQHMQLVLRKRYVWKLRMSSTPRFAKLREYHVSWSTKPRRKIILGPIKRFEELRWNLEQRRWLQNFWHTTYDSRAAGYDTWENKVKKLIEKFENHQHKESFFQDLSQTQKINKFSKESQDWIADMNNTKIFELCENSSKQQRFDCNAHWEIRIVYCSCGRNMKSSQSPTEFDQNNRDVTLIPGYVIEKNSSRGAKHGPSERPKMYYLAKQMLKKARQKKHGSHPTILARWYASETYRTSLSRIVWREHHVMLHDRIAVEKHIYVTARAERIQNSKHRILTINAEGPQPPLNQRSDFAQAKRECERLHDEHLAMTQEEYRTIPRSHHIRQRKGTTTGGNEEYDYAVDPETGWRFYKGPRRHDRGATCKQLRHRRQRETKPVEDEQLEYSVLFTPWRLVKFFLRVRTVSVDWRKNNRQSTGSVNSTPTNTAHVELHSMITLNHPNTRGSRAGRLRIAHLCVPQTVAIHVSCLIPCRTWHWPPAQVLSHLFHPLILSFRRSHLCKQATRASTHKYPAMFHGRVADQHISHLSQIMSPTRLRPKSSRPKRSSLKTSSPEELSLTEIVGQIQVKYRKDSWETLFLKIWMNLEKLVRRCPASSHRCIPIMTQRRALQTRILKMENYKECWLQHCVCKVEKTVNPLECHFAPGKLAALLQERGASAKRTQADRRESLMSSASQEPSAPGKPAALFFSGNEEPGNQFQSSIFKNADPSNLGRSLIAMKMICSVRQDLNLWNRNIKLDLLTIVSVSFSNKLMLKDWNYRTLNTDLLSLDENKFVYKKNYPMKEKVLRDTQIRTMHKMGDMKRAQELRVDEVSVQKLRENHEQCNSSLLSCRKCKNGWILWMTQENFKKWNQISVGDCLTFLVSLQWFQVLVPCWVATNACLVTHGIHRDNRKTFLGNQFSTFDSPRDHLQGIHPCAPQRERGSVPQVTGTGTCRKRWPTK